MWPEPQECRLDQQECCATVRAEGTTCRAPTSGDQGVAFGPPYRAAAHYNLVKLVGSRRGAIRGTRQLCNPIVDEFHRLFVHHIGGDMRHAA